MPFYGGGYEQLLRLLFGGSPFGQAQQYGNPYQVQTQARPQLFSLLQPFGGPQPRPTPRPTTGAPMIPPPVQPAVQPMQPAVQAMQQVQQQPIQPPPAMPERQRPAPPVQPPQRVQRPTPAPSPFTGMFPHAEQFAPENPPRPRPGRPTSNLAMPWAYTPGRPETYSPQAYDSFLGRRRL